MNCSDGENSQVTRSLQGVESQIAPRQHYVYLKRAFGLALLGVSDCSVIFSPSSSC